MVELKGFRERGCKAQIPVGAQIGKTQWNTSLWPKDGLYIPVKLGVRKAEIEEGDSVSVRLEVGPSPKRNEPSTLVPTTAQKAAP